LFVLGVIGLLWLLVNNINKTDINIAILGTIFQLLIYAVLALVGILVLFVLLFNAYRYYGYDDNR